VTCFVEDAGFLLSNLGPENTGVVGGVVWLAAGEFTTDEAYLGPRILVVPGEALSMKSLTHAVALTLSRPAAVIGTLPDELRNKALRFVEHNLDVLLEYWGGEMDTFTAIERLDRLAAESFSI
jgi:hypothetical protein